MCCLSYKEFDNLEAHDIFAGVHDETEDSDDDEESGSWMVCCQCAQALFLEEFIEFIQNNVVLVKKECVNHLMV